MKLFPRVKKWSHTKLLRFTALNKIGWHKIINKYRIISKNSKLLLSTFLLFFILWIVFDSIKFRWADDPFQKVVLAPLGEEPFKLTLTFIICFGIFMGSMIGNKLNKKPLKGIDFFDIFSYTFVFFAILPAILLGYIEGGLNNIQLHFSFTLISAILIVIIYRWLKDKNLKLYHKLFSGLFAILPSMFLHSVANQYMNITSVTSKNSYLVTVAKFLQTNTNLKDQTAFTNTLLTIALVILLAYLVKYLLVPLVLKFKNHKTDSIEKINLNYWLKLYSNIIVLFIFLFLSAFLLVNGILYDFDISLSAGLISSLITVYLFTYLFERKEKIIWKKVKGQVMKGLKRELSGLLTDIMLPLERVGGRYAIRMPEGEDENEVFRKHRLRQFRDLVKADRIEFSDSYLDILKQRGFGDLFLSRKEFLNEIEYKYSKHLEPQIILSLIKLQRSLRDIDTLMGIKSKEQQILLPMADDEFFKRLAGYFHETLKELYKLYRLNLVDV